MHKCTAATEPKIVHCNMSNLPLILCLCLVFVGLESSQIHEQMTDQELQSVFHTDRNSVPEYEVVPVTYSLPDDNEYKKMDVRFKAFGEDVILDLDPTENVLLSKSTPIYTVASNSSYESGLIYNLLSGKELNDRSRIYEDPKKMASLISHQGEDGKIRFNGVFGRNFIIKSLPKRVLEIVVRNISHNRAKVFPPLRERRSQVEFKNYHVVMKQPMKNRSRLLEKHEMLEKWNSAMKKENWPDHGVGRKPPKTIYPEILVIVDFDAFKSHGLNPKKALIYYAAFFNAVDLKYRTLKDPEVRLNIAAIILSMDRAATPYLNKGRISENLVEAGSLDELSLYLYKESRFSRDSYDAVITITKSQLCQFPKKSRSSSCPQVRGISKYGSACNWDDTTKRVEAVALIHDTGFSGIPTAAHELAHVFGVPHDGSPSLAYVGGPGARKCKWEDGYLMSSFRHDQHALKWSNCSQQCFRYFLNKPQAKCLYNKPVRMAGAMPKILPGTLLNVDEQCFKAIGGESCWHNENVCTLLWCRVPNTDSDCIASTPAAEGSECGIEKICVMGKCERKTEQRPRVHFGTSPITSRKKDVMKARR